MNRGLLVSSGERKTYEILSQYDELEVFAKVRFFDVINWNTFGIAPDEHHYLQKTHFDFVVCEKDQNRTPLFAIEFDGLGDDGRRLDRYRGVKHQTKTRVCAQEGFPIIWLGWHHLELHESESVLDGLIQNYLLYRTVATLRRNGEIPADDGPVFMFRPMIRLLTQLEGPLMRGNSLIENFYADDDELHVTRVIEVRTVDGPIIFRGSARMRMIGLPDFHPGELLLDIATMRCLQKIRNAVSHGELIVRDDRVYLNR